MLIVAFASGKAQYECAFWLIDEKKRFISSHLI